MDTAFAVLAFTSIFVIVDPIANVITFVALTAGMGAKEVTKTNIRSVVTACALLIIFAMAGEALLTFFNITVDYLRVAGGILLLSVSYEMMHGRRSREGYTPEEAKEAAEKEDFSIFPLAMPMLTGPGAITTVIILMKTAETPENRMLIFAAIFITFALTFALFAFAGKIHKVLGITVSMVVMRVMGLFLAAISVQFIAVGIWNIFKMLAV
jgi:multiple antibiotic resistance protein